MYATTYMCEPQGEGSASEFAQCLLTLTIRLAIQVPKLNQLNLLVKSYNLLVTTSLPINLPDQLIIYELASWTSYERLYYRHPANAC